MSDAYSDPVGRCDISPFIIGDSFGPMRFTPETADPLTGRTYFGAVFARGTQTKIADMVVTVVDEALGSLEASMTDTESAKVPQGTSEYVIWYTTTAPATKKTHYTGNLVGVYR